MSVALLKLSSQAGMKMASFPTGTQLPPPPPGTLVAEMEYFAFSQSTLLPPLPLFPK